MKRKAGTVCMGLGIVLLFAAMSLFLWNRWEERQAEKAAEEILPGLLEAIEPPDKVSDPYDPEMTVKEIDGYGYIGYLSIPSSGLELPVMSEWDYKRLKIAPCRYTGSVKTDNLVIAAHNYARHFRPLWKIPVGETVYFTDMDGIRYTYTVSEVETLSPTAVEDMTSGEYDLTLFTCTYGGKTRVTVRCDRSDGSIK